jgi:hypothetical protein
MTEPSPSLSWRRHEFKEARIRLELLDGPEVERIDRADGAAVRPGEAEGPVTEQAIVQNAAPVSLRAAVGPDATIEDWRKRVGAFITVSEEPREAITLCGQQASRQVARLTSPERLTTTTHGKVKVPAEDRTTVLVSFRHHDRPVLVAWTIATADRELHRAAEERFFASVECL